MVIQSGVLRMILGRDIPFVYPNHECAQYQKKILDFFYLKLIYIIGINVEAKLGT
jgi:hypothetical protein